MTLRALLAADDVTHVPGVWDPLSATLAVRAGSRAVHLSGAAVAAVALGRPDLGRVGVTQIADRASVLVPALDGVPALADTDAGFDSPRDAVWSALAYQRAGLAGLRLENPAVASVAAIAGEVPEMVVVVGVGPRSLGTAIPRCRDYATAGADAIVVEGVDDPADVARLHAALPGVPLVLIRSQEAGLSDQKLARYGVRLVLHPMTALLAATRAASLAYRALAERGTAADVDLMPPAAFTALVEPPPADTLFTPARLDT